MALRGKAFITMWHDVEPSAQEDWHAWHTHEHMPERVAIAGFEGGRRYWNDTLQRHRCFTLYEAATAEVFRSPAYLERLNNPTPWTTRLAPSFRNFLRIACDTLASEGAGIGGSIATWRLSLAPGTTLDAAAMAAELRRHRPVTAVHVGKARPDITAYRTTEADLRPQGEEAGFDALILAEGVGHAMLAGVVPEITSQLRAMDGVTEALADIYDLSFRIAALDMR